MRQPQNLTDFLPPRFQERFGMSPLRANVEFATISTADAVFKECKMAVVTLTENNFQSEVLESKIPALVDFWASWCGPCRSVSPLVDELAGEHPEYKFCKVNVDEQPELAGRFNVMSIPNLVVFKDGKTVSQSAGARPKEQILDLLKNA